MATDFDVQQLRTTLAQAKEIIQQQQAALDHLSEPPNQLAVFARWFSETDRLAIVSAGGRDMRVPVAKDILPFVGQRVLLSPEGGAVIGLDEYPVHGAVVKFDHALDDGRLYVKTCTDEGIIVTKSRSLRGLEIKSGSSLMLDEKSGIAIEVISGPDETQDLMLEDVPDVSYSDIGGLDTQLQEIHDSIELPYLHADLFKKYHRRAPKGILLYGPPGCGKTLVAKAVANNLAKKSGREKAHFLNIKGPELLNKWVGETERSIREVFAKARELGSEGDPVIIFFDEMESMFRQRGAGISSDVESTIVPSLLAEMDGVEGLNNVIVIGASNRQDLIDPAILRPGRLDVKIMVGRPDSVAAYAILEKYLTDDLPYGEPISLGSVIDAMYAEEKDTEFLEVTYQNGQKETLHFKDFSSGAMIASIVDRAKTSAIKDELEEKGTGITLKHLLDAVAAEFKENEDLPNTSNPDDWAKISGRKGERIAHVRPLLREEDDKETKTIDPGMYL